MYLKKIIILYFLFFIILTNLFSNTIVKAGVSDNAPLVYRERDNTYKGVFVDLLEYIAKKENWELQYSFTNWSGCLDLLDTGKISIIIDIAYSKERAKKYAFNQEPVFINWGKLYLQKGQHINNLYDLNNKKIAVMKDDIYYIGDDGFRALLRSFGIDCTFYEAKDYQEVFQHIEKKDVYAGIVNRLFGDMNDSEFKVESSSFFFKPVNLMYAFPKNSELTPVLISALDKHIEKLKKDPDSFYYKTLDKYFINTNTTEIIPVWLIYLIAGSSIIFIIFSLISYVFILKKQVNNKTRQLKKLASTDSLTGLNNRGHFMDLFENEIQRSSRNNTDLSLILFDIDHFKRINDTYGHTIGDKVLTRIGEIIRSTKRKIDIAGRYGGEEFCVLLPGIKIQNALNFAQRLKTNIKKTIFYTQDEKEFNTSCSFGVIEFNKTDDSIITIINKADEALYAGKNYSRDCIVYLQETAEEKSRKLFLYDEQGSEDITDKLEEIK